MDLINWSLNAMDTFFSMRSHSSGEPLCPHGTLPAGYTMDGWRNWRILCLAGLSIEDIEDDYLFGTLITGFLLIGAGMALGYRKLKKAVTGFQLPTALVAGVDSVSRAVSNQSVVLDDKLDTNREKLSALMHTGATNAEQMSGMVGAIARLDRSMDTILERLTALQREIERPADQ